MSEQQQTTKKSKKSLETARTTWGFIKEDFAEGHAHKAAGKPVAWACSLIEKELFYAMGIHPYYPEQYASLCAVMRKTPESEKEAVRLARIAEQAGYASELCGYERVVTGYVIEGNLSDAPLGGMAMPDMIVTTSGTCDMRLKWFEDMAQRLKVPMFTFDRPERIFDDMIRFPKTHEIRYYRSEIEDFLSFVTGISGQKYDPERLNECLDWSYKTNELRLEILELRKNIPSPMGCADAFATMYPGLYCSGRKKAYDFYRGLRDEVKLKVEKGQGQIENERFRLLWWGIPTWFNMALFNYFEPIGGVFAYEPGYNPYPWPARNNQDPLDELVTRTLMTGTSVNSKFINPLLEQCKEYKISGAVLAFLITCRPYYIAALEVQRSLERELGIPTVLVECDLVDERTFSEGQVRTRFDAFAEQILKKQNAANK
jgi:benzoyl-CoA reductase/2-hydroxyglutaryl-CoA dehydratase subunit BcrC/BadD/HgdB